MSGTQVFSLFAKLGLDTSEFDSGLSDAESAGASFGSGFEGVVNKAKQALVAAGLVATIKNIAENIFSLADETAAYADGVAKTSRELGVSAQAYQVWDHAMQHAGTSMAESGRSFRTLRQNIANGSDAFKDAVAKVGLAYEDFFDVNTGEILPIETVFQRIGEALTQMEDNADKSNLMNTIFGAQGNNYASLFMFGANIEAALAEANEKGRILTDEQLAQGENFQDQLYDLKTTFENVRDQIVFPMMDTISAVMQKVSDLLGELAPTVTTGIQTGDWSEFFGVIQQFITDLMGDDDTIIAGIGTALKGVFDAFKWIADNWETVKTALETVFGFFVVTKVTTTVEQIGKLTGALGGLLSKLLGFGSADAAKGLQNLGKASGGSSEASAAGGGLLATLGKTVAAAGAFVVTLAPQLFESEEQAAQNAYYADNPESMAPYDWQAHEAKVEEQKAKKAAHDLISTAETSFIWPYLFSEKDQANQFDDQSVTIPIEPQVKPESKHTIQTELDKWMLQIPVSPYLVGNDYGLTSNDGSLSSRFSTMKATGLDYIPYDGFRMTAHRGEMLLNAVEAQNWRSGATSGGATSADIGDAVRAAVSGLAVNMDGRSVGTMVAQTVSDEIQIKARRNRF